MYSQSRVFGSVAWRIVAACSIILGLFSWVGVTSAAQTGTSDIAVVTTLNGASFYNACFVLVDYSLEGCDANGDGDITFDDIPYGTYTLRQTRALESGMYVPDSTIRVTGNSDWDGRERFYVSVLQPQQPVNISLITRDPADGSLLTDTCYVLVDYSNEGCDQNGDGQVTFDAIPVGTYMVRQTRTPAGFPAVNDFEIVVQNVNNVSQGFVVKQAPEQNEPNTRNVSIVFVDRDNPARLPSNICIELVGASNVGCDEDLQDGQIDFLDVPAGKWNLSVSNVPEDWSFDISAPVVVDASEGSATHQFHTVLITVRAPTYGSTTETTNTSANSTSSGIPMISMMISAQGPTGFVDGARFVVRSETGQEIGSCTLVDTGEPIIQSCIVNVPDGVTVVVTIDMASVPAGLVPVENPIRFHTGSRPMASFWGVVFVLGAQ